VTEGWENSITKKLIIVPYTNNTVMIKARKLRRKKHVACMREIRNW
jgi:hypothetical protein